jgi:hypothetical protein
MEQSISLTSVSKKAKIVTILLCLGCVFAIFLLIPADYRAYIVEMGYLRWTGLVALCAVILIPLHEGMHGLFFRLFGGKVSFGARLKTSFGPVFWATSPKMYSKRQFQIIGLAPQLLTVICLLMLGHFSPVVNIGLIITAVGNLLGGVFDIYISVLLRRFPAGVLVRDTMDGCVIYR